MRFNCGGYSNYMSLSEILEKISTPSDIWDAHINLSEEDKEKLRRIIEGDV